MNQGLNNLNQNMQSNNEMSDSPLTNINENREEKPNYILKFNDVDLKKVNDKNSKIKKVVIIIIAIIIIGSFIFQDNLFLELSWTARILLISLALGIMFTGKYEKIPSPMELRFYNDYLVVYWEKKYFNPKVTRMMYDKFYYKDIHKIQFRKNIQRINIYGIFEGIWYDYNKDGSLPKNPTYHKTVDSIAYFYTRLNSNIDFVNEIDSHSPVKVSVENN